LALDTFRLAEPLYRSRGPPSGRPHPIHFRCADKLLAHPLTRAVLVAVGDRPRSWPSAVKEILERAPQWGRTYQVDHESVERALAQYLWLLSEARRRGAAGPVPLFGVEIQLWIREVSRLLRTVDVEPSFRWRDSAEVVTEDGPVYGDSLELPSTYCRRCGMSGWMAIASETSDALGVNPNHIYRSSVQRSPLVRTMLLGNAADESVRWFSPSDRTLADTPSEGSLPVLVTDGEDAARQSRCPGCEERDGIRFLGLAVASLASVSINALFGSNHLEGHEQKLLAFTDSVQDASHRASFFGGRTHRFNLRALMSQALADAGELSVADLGTALIDSATNPRDLFSLVPPDLLRHPVVRTVWTDRPSPRARDLLAARLGFEADLEFGLRARVGRTLELSRAASARVAVDDLDHWAGVVGEELQRVVGSSADPLAVVTYVRGLVERLRLRGGLMNPLLEPFVDDGGSQWFIWGGRPDGLPPFTPDRGRPAFFTTKPKGDLDSLQALSTNPTWVVDWAMRSLGVTAQVGRDLNLFTMALLAAETEAVVAQKVSGHTVYGIDRRSVLVSDVVDEESLDPDVDSDVVLTPNAVRCAMCGHLHVAPPELLDEWVGTPCLRYRCGGSFERAVPRPVNYYRDLYRNGRVTRVVTGEHTGLLKRAPREDLEAAFKAGTAPDAPNVLTATPTLEMGIDIGDLSSVMLTSVPRTPASYIQRVGRSGRSSGNSLVTTFVPTDTHGLYYLADPEAMLAGDVRPPNCYLDASEILQRQYIAYLVDRTADGAIDAPLLPRKISKLMKKALDSGGLLRAVIDASVNDASHVDAFLELFGDSLSERSRDSLREFAAAGIEAQVKEAVDTWTEHQDDLSKRIKRLTAAADRLEGQAGRTDDDEQKLSDLYGQRSAVRLLLNEHREEYSLSGLERLRLLPNFMLLDDTITLDASMWSRDEAGEFHTEVVEYQRGGRRGIIELAPGNSFYAAGHRHVIDALEIGTADAPAYETWRLCPDCGYGAIDEGSAPAECVRCRSKRIADTGAKHQMLRLKRSYASGSEEGARVYDESDQRRRERYDDVLCVDVDPQRIEGAWTLADKAFGAEFAGGTHFRTINLGLAERSGEKRSIAGNAHHVTGFTVCAFCGAVRDVRQRTPDTSFERLHQGWCTVRSGKNTEQWQQVVLYHELNTESVRMLLPVSMFEVGERLASFKGALLLGLRADFGGDPSHLEVALTDAPNAAGQGRRRYLMLFDSVPGGTGYLARLAEPDRVKTILTHAREVIAHCPCSIEGRQACHRCLLGVVDRNEYDLARRDLALEVLDDLLGAWEPQSVASVAEIEIGKVEESELERRFKAALQSWTTNVDDENISITDVPGTGRYRAFELRLDVGGLRTRYRIEEQEGLSTSPSVLPDFLITRMDDRGQKIAVFLDGFQFHASTDLNNIAVDAAKRRGLRESGNLVWNLTWDDVDAFHKSALVSPPTEAAARVIVGGEARRNGQKLQLGRGGVYEIDALNQNPMALLLDFLARPNMAQWSQLARSAVGGLLAASGDRGSLGIPDGEAFLRRAAAGLTPVWPGGEVDEVALAARHETTNGLGMTVLMDTRPGRQADERWTVVSALPDADRDLVDANHRGRWRDWAQWANVLQFISGPGRHGIVSATSDADDLPLEDHWLVALAHPSDDEPMAEEADDVSPSVALTESGAAAPGISDDMVEELDLLEDEAVKVLVEKALALGAPEFVAGEELAGIPVEAAWSDAKVGVLGADGEDPGTAGWDLRPADGWTPESLLAAVKGQS
jgi:hypothetical protein